MQRGGADGVIALQGGGPFESNDELDRQLLGGIDRVVMLPTADAFEQPARLVEAAAAWGARIGVEVESLMVMTRADADESGPAAAIDAVEAVVLAGDSASHLRSVLKDTPLFDALSRLVDRAPHRMDGRFAFGVALEQLKQFQPAAEQFRAVLNVAPSHAGAAKHLGLVLHSLNRREEALTAYRLALPLDPGSVDLHNDLGVLLAEMGMLTEAEQHFAEAVRLDPKDQQAKENLAKVREFLKRGK